MQNFQVMTHSTVERVKANFFDHSSFIDSSAIRFGELGMLSKSMVYLGLSVGLASAFFFAKSDARDNVYNKHRPCCSHSFAS